METGFEESVISCILNRDVCLCGKVVGDRDELLQHIIHVDDNPRN